MLNRCAGHCSPWMKRTAALLSSPLWLHFVGPGCCSTRKSRTLRLSRLTRLSWRLRHVTSHSYVVMFHTVCEEPVQLTRIIALAYFCACIAFPS